MTSGTGLFLMPECRCRTDTQLTNRKNDDAGINLFSGIPEFRHLLIKPSSPSLPHNLSAMATPTKRPTSKGPASKGPGTKGPAAEGPEY